MDRIRCAYGLLVTLIIGAVLCWAVMANAKDATLVIDYAMDEGVEVVSYGLHCTRVPGSGTIELVGTSSGSLGTPWVVDVADIPPGKTLDWYMTSTDLDGDIGWSKAYPFKLVGNPKIITVRIVK